MQTREFTKEEFKSIAMKLMWAGFFTGVLVGTLATLVATLVAVL